MFLKMKVKVNFTVFCYQHFSRNVLNFQLKIFVESLSFLCIYGILHAKKVRIVNFIFLTLESVKDQVFCVQKYPALRRPQSYLLVKAT